MGSNVFQTRIRGDVLWKVEGRHLGQFGFELLKFFHDRRGPPFPELVVAGRNQASGSDSAVSGHDVRFGSIGCGHVSQGNRSGVRAKRRTRRKRWARLGSENTSGPPDPSRGLTQVDGAIGLPSGALVQASFLRGNYALSPGAGNASADTSLSQETPEWL